MLPILITAFGYLAVIFFPLGQLARLSFFNQQARIYPYEGFMFFGFVCLLLRHSFKPLRETSSYKHILLFLIILILSFLLTIYKFDLYANTIGFMYLVRLCFYFLYFVYTVFHLNFYKKEKIHIFHQLQFTIWIIVISSVLQYLFYPDLRNLLYQGWDPHLYRVFSFFFEPYLAGAALVLAFYFVHFRMFNKEKCLKIKMILLGLIFVLIMLTFSRTVYLAFLGSLFFLLIKEGKFKLFGLTILAFVILAIFIPKPVGVGVQLFRTFSIETRINNAVEGIRIWLEEPVIGVGYNRIRYKKAALGLTDKYDGSHAASSYHSSFVTILVAAGACGIIAFLILLRKLASLSEPAFYYILFLSLLSIGDNALLHPFMLFLYLRLLMFESSQSSLA